MKRFFSIFLTSFVILTVIISCSQSVNKKVNVNVSVYTTTSGGISGGEEDFSDIVVVTLEDGKFRYYNENGVISIRSTKGEVKNIGDNINEWVKPDPTSLGLNAVLRLDTYSGSLRSKIILLTNLMIKI